MSEGQGPATGGYMRVAALSDVPPNSLLGIEIGDERICLAHADGRIYAFRDNCTHRDFPLSQGVLEDGEVECTWHGAKFEAKSGRATRLPAIKPVKTYEVRVEGDDILVAVNGD